jgi:hypothetical protein
MLRYLLDTVGGVYELARLAVISRFRFGGEYWRWRMQTAFGPTGRPPPPPAEHGRYSGTRGSHGARAVLDYARWVRRMRRQM